MRQVTIVLEGPIYKLFVERLKVFLSGQVVIANKQTS